MKIAETPFTVIIDRQEKAPYAFSSIRTDSDRQYRPLVVKTRFASLATGDYSIEGFESAVTVERKSLSDLYTTIGQHRERFEREHERMAEMEFAAVVIEEDWNTILRQPPTRTRLPPKNVFRTAVSWMQRYGVPWLAMADRRLAELVTFRLLEKFWKEKKMNRRDSGTQRKKASLSSRPSSQQLEPPDTSHEHWPWEVG